MTKQVLGYPELEWVTALLAYIGMLCILGAFALETRGIIHSRGRSYLGLMAFGSGILGIRAVHTGEWAFVVLEVAWMLASLVALVCPPVVDGPDNV
ncbi:MAG: hypothetical protein MK233_05190 [Candidatus Poseidoniales archaeon]|jgi:hypothetical protein|nr:hypothetical protein [Candidatus Poseidoniales archaeon]